MSNASGSEGLLEFALVFNEFKLIENVSFLFYHNIVRYVVPGLTESSLCFCVIDLMKIPAKRSVQFQGHCCVEYNH